VRQKLGSEKKEEKRRYLAECLVNKSLVAGAESVRWLEVANSRRLLRSKGPVNDDAMLRLHRVSVH
jgi:hypothetical protein